MQIQIKTLHGKQFSIDVDVEKETVQDLKEKILRLEGDDCKVDCQKLIYEGKILVNSNKLSEYNLDPKKFIVLLIVRLPPTPKVAEPKNEETSGSKSDNKPKYDIKTSSTSTTPSRPGSSTVTTDRSTSSTPNQPQQAPPSNTSAPASSQQQPPPQSAQAQTTGPRSSSRSANQMAVEASIAGRLNSLMNHPHFANLQSTIHQNPHLLSSAIESLSTADPEMYQFVSENPDVFLNALNTAPPAAMASHREQMRAAGQRRPDPTGRGQALVSGGSVDQLTITHMLPSATDQDRQAIERLKELGFSEFQAVEAYLACEKDEQVAADLLFRMDQ